jgi:Amt family ammonium transporter
MNAMKISRAGLLALAGAILLAIVLSLPTWHASYAEDAPAAAPAAAAPAAPPPACDGNAKPPVLENCTPNSGDTAWMLTSMAIVLMMTIPGLALFYGGMVRKKNIGDTVMTSFAITCLVSILWLLFTYSLAFRSGTPFIGGLDRAFLQGIVSNTFNADGVGLNIGTPNPLAPTIPETVYSMFQLTFAIITAALIAGSFAERMKFSAMLWRFSSIRRSHTGCGARMASSTAPIPTPNSTSSTSPVALWCM